MTKYLIVSGCSFTTSHYRSSFHPEVHALWPKWPELLADKLDLKLINLGASGAGNEYILSSLVDEINKRNVNDIEMVIAAWSRCDRRDYSINGRWTNDRVDSRGDLDYHISRTNRYKQLLESFCNDKKVSCKQFQMIELYRGDMDTVQGKTMKTDPENIISDKDRHPNAKGHQLIMEYVYENL